MVRIYWRVTNPSSHLEYGESCSGSVIARGLILTAGHCVFSNQHDGTPHSGFVNYYDLTTYTVVPDNTLINGVNSAPYGGWSVKNMWTTSDYASSGGVGGDWGIIEVNPNAQGQYPGDVVGNLVATWNQPTIDQLYSTGYPASFGFALAQYGGGALQYFCDDVWSEKEDHESSAEFGTYYAMLIKPCEETGGASGGPVLTDTSTGWTVIGVNNRGPEPPSQNAFGTYMLSFYLEGRFGEFWDSVVNQVNSGA